MQMLFSSTEVNRPTYTEPIVNKLTEKGLEIASAKISTEEVCLYFLASFDQI